MYLIQAPLKALRTVKDSAKVRDIPGHTDIEWVGTLPSGYQVVLYTPSSGWREYEVVEVSGDEIRVLMPSGKLFSFPTNVVSPLYKKSSSRESEDDGASKAFDVKGNTNTKRAQQHMITRLWVKSENFGTGFYFMNSGNYKEVYS